MISKRIATSCMAASLIFGPVAPAMADGNALVGGIIGGMIGGAIVNEAQKNKKKTVRTTSTVSSATREANREVQVALNYFGYPVGTPDGVLGQQSRAAIGQYQASLGYTPTGQLTEYERSHLIASYHRGVAGGPMTMQQAAANPMGMRGLPAAWRDEAMGIQPPGTMAAAPAAPVAPVPESPVVAAEPVQPAAPAQPGLPSFLGNAPVMASLASQCNKVSLMASTNGGYTTVATMTDPNEALGEQFCVARSYAIAQGEEMLVKVQGFTPEQVAQQCAGLAPAMQAQTAALALKPADQVMNEVQSFALSTGMAPAQLAATAKICLSVGYKQDDMGIALSSALLLVALGEGGYGELMGHHLSQGFGAPVRPDLALAWYEMGLDATSTPSAAVFAPGQPERNDLIRRAAFTIGGKADQAALPAPVPAALPTFSAPVPAPAAQPETVAASATPEGSGTTMTQDQVGALPLAARLPFLLFKN